MLIFLVKIATLKIVVNEVWSIDTIDTKKLSRYLRILFQLSLNTKDSVAEELLDQVASLAHDAGEVGSTFSDMRTILTTIRELRVIRWKSLNGLLPLLSIRQ